MKFSRRMEIERQFIKFCREESEKLREKGQIPKNAGLTEGASSFIAWLIGTEEGKMVLKELYEDVYVKTDEEKNSD